MRITERDFDLLAFLGAQGVATADQIRERFFVSRWSCWKRLHFLKKAGFVEGVSVEGLKSISQAAYWQAADLLAVSKEDLWKYRIYRLAPRLRPRRMGADMLGEPMYWRHQIQLNGVRKLCEELVPDALILTDPDVRQELAGLGSTEDALIPDLVLRGSGREVAVEMERTMKSDRQYYDRFITYRDSHYSHVLYFCETDKIFRKVADLSGSFPRIRVSSLLNKRMVFRSSTGFEPIEEFLGVA